MGEQAFQSCVPWPLPLSGWMLCKCLGHQREVRSLSQHSSLPAGVQASVSFDTGGRRAATVFHSRSPAASLEVVDGAEVARTAAAGAPLCLARPYRRPKSRRIALHRLESRPFLTSRPWRPGSPRRSNFNWLILWQSAAAFLAIASASLKVSSPPAPTSGLGKAKIAGVVDGRMRVLRPKTCPDKLAKIGLPQNLNIGCCSKSKASSCNQVISLMSGRLTLCG